MNKIIFCFFSSFLYIISPLVAQPEINFKVTKHNFGEITEGTIATFDFVFTNTGNVPLVISNVQASCGCTTPNWTKEPVMPGKTGIITAAYNSQGRPGVFTKSISVTTNAPKQEDHLLISGTVVRGNVTAKPTSKQELENSPKIQLPKHKLSVGKVQKGHSVPLTFSVVNNGKSPLLINGIRSSCNCVFFDPTAIKNIGPGYTVDLKIIYKPATIGVKNEEIKIFTNDVATPEALIVVAAEVVDDIKNESMIKKDAGTLSF